MDRFLEEAVSKRNRALDEILYYASLVLMIVTGVLGFLFLQSVMAAGLGALIPAVVMIGIAVYLWFTHDKFRTEYEYTFTNGELDIDKIIAKKKRSEMLTVNVRKFTAFGKYEDGMEETEDMTILLVSDNIASHEYYADFEHEDYGKTRLVFCPNEKML